MDLKVLFLIGMSVLWMSVLSFCWVKRRELQKITSGVRKLLQEKIRVYFQIRDKDFFLLISILVGASIVFACVLPITYDECFTYNHFVSQGVWKSWSTYPAPNNHVLHSIVASILNHLPGDFPLFYLRLPNIIISAFIWIVGYEFISSNYSRKAALVFICLGGISAMNMHYSFVSRGYTYIAFFVLCLLMVCLKIKREGPFNVSYALITIISFLGFITIPSFLYPYASIQLWLLFQFPKKWKIQIGCGAFLIIAVISFYTPIIMRDGLSALIHNPYVKSIERDIVIRNLPEFVLNLSKALFGILALGFAILIVWCLVKLFSNKRYSEAWLFVSLLVLPWLLMTVQSVLPFSRTFNYYAIVSALMCAIALVPYLQKVNMKWMLPIIVILQIGMLVRYYYSFRNTEEQAFEAKRVYDKVKEKSSCLIDDNLLEAYLTYYSKSNGRKIQFYSLMKNEKISDYKQDFECIIVNRAKSDSINSQLLFSGEYYNVYSK